MSKRSLANTALLAILLLSAVLRLWNLDATEFKYDEAKVCNLAAHFVDTGVPPVQGMGSSTGIDNPPLAIYLMSLPILFSRDPLVATAYVALLNVAGVYACYWLGKRHWSTLVGLVAAALFAASPWAVFYSRKVWAQNLLPPFVALFFAFLIAWSTEGRRWALSGAIIALTALTQIHMATVSLVLVFAAATLLTAALCPSSRRVSHWGKPLLVGTASSVLLYAPYLVHDALSGWGNVRAIVTMFGTPAATYWDAVRFALLNIGGREIHALAGPARFRDFLGSILDLNYWPDRIQEALTLTSIAYLLARMWRRRGNRRALLRDALLMLWVAVPVLAFLRSRSPVYPHYLIPLYPAPYLVLALGATDLVQATGTRPRMRRTVRVVGSILGSGLIAWQVYLSLSIHTFVERHHTPDGVGTPIGILRRVASTIDAYADAWDSGEAIVLCPGDDPAIHECPAVFEFMAGRDMDLRFVDYNSSLLFPQSSADTLFIVAPGESIAAQEIARHAGRLIDDTVWLREQVDAYRFYRMTGGYAPRPSTQPDGLPVHLENGVSLHGYDLAPSPVPGVTTRLTLYWRVDAVPPSPPPQGYSFANHLLSADGHRYGQKDGPGYSAHAWEDGDAIVSWFEIPVAADAPQPPYTLRVGMYTYIPPDEYIPVVVIDEAGRRALDAVEWSIQ